MTGRYVVDYRRGAGRTPWAVYGVVPVALVRSGRVWLADFATQAEALMWIETEARRASRALADLPSCRKV